VFTSIAVVPTGGIALGGYTSSWGAGNFDMWTTRLAADGSITFNAPSAATRYASGFAVTNVNTVANAGGAVLSLASTATAVAPAVTVSTPGFAQNAQAP